MKRRLRRKGKTEPRVDFPTAATLRVKTIPRTPHARTLYQPLVYQEGEEEGKGG